MIMEPRLSKAMLTAHITFSVGWIGTVSAFLALAIVGLVGNDQTVRASYLAMELIARVVIVPFCLASFLTGLVQALGTHWGLISHYWVIAKLVLTLVSTIVLLLHMQPIAYLSKVALDTTLSNNELRGLRIQMLADAGAALMVLLVVTTISVYKPWGKVQYGILLPRLQAATKQPFGLYMLIGIIAVLIAFIILHFVEGRPSH